MATHVTSSALGDGKPATGPSTTKGPGTTTLSSKQTPSSKARLLFNSDGSVQLLGHPNQFPGSGINSKSHSLVPTVGPDGTMTMLLTPLDGLGKTFILNPTNGCSLPNSILSSASKLQPTSSSLPNSILPSASKPKPTSASLPNSIPPSASKPKQTSSSLSNSKPQPTSSSQPNSVTTARNAPSLTMSASCDAATKTVKMLKTPNTTATKSYQSKWPRRRQKSLLTDFGKKSQVNSNSPQFVTHMRIDPSGSSISTVNVPLANPTSQVKSDQAVLGSAALKPVSDKVKPGDVSQTNPPVSSEKNIPVLIESPTVTPSMKFPCGGIITADGKQLPLANNQWITLNSVVPGSTSNNSAATLTSTGNLKMPTTTASKPLTYFLVSSNSVPGQYNVIYSPGVVSGPIIRPQNPPLVSSAPQVKLLSTPSQVVTTPTQIPTARMFNPLVNQNPIPAPKVVVYPHEHQGKKHLPVGGRLPSTIVLPSNTTANSLAVDKSQIVIKFPISNNQVKTTDKVDYNNTMSIKSEIKQEGTRCLDPATGHLITTDAKTEPEDDDSMCLKIDSVFSLSTCDGIENKSSGIKIKEEPMDHEPCDITEKKESKETKQQTITCNPSYVVLDRLSQEQIKNYKTSIVKCSNYCRVRTLNFLCNLGLVECEPTIHTVHSKTEPAQIDSDENRKLVEKETVPSFDAINTRKRKPKVEEDASDTNCSRKILKKENVLKSPAKYEETATDSNVDGKQIHTKENIPKTENKSPVNIRKVDSPASPVTKVLKFTKVDKDQVNSPVVSTPDKKVISAVTSQGSSLAKQQSPAVKVQASKVIPGSPPVQLTTNVQSSVPLTKLQDSTKKQYFLFNVNGQNILVPTSNDMQKPKAFVLKGNPKTVLPAQVSSKTCATPSQSSTSLLKKTTPPVSKSDIPKQIKTPETNVSTEKPVEVLKTVHKNEDNVFPLVKIKSEPITHGYGDEEPKNQKSNKKPRAKVKQEPLEWEEIWSSSSTPVTDPKTVSEVQKSNTKSKSVIPSCESSMKSHLLPERTEQIDPGPEMPELPLMKVPSTKEIEKKTAAHNDRIERLKAMLREKEKLIEDLKTKRYSERSVFDGDLFTNSGPTTSAENTVTDTVTDAGRAATESNKEIPKTMENSTNCYGHTLDDIGTSETESCDDPRWSAFDLDDDIN